VGWILFGLLILGVALIGGVFLVRNNKGKSSPEPAAPKNTRSQVLLKDSAEFIPELEKHIREGNYELIDEVVDEAGSFPPDKQVIIRQFIIDSGALERYKTGLADVDYKIRALSADRLGKIRARDTSALLFQAMADKNEEVRLIAATALKSVGDPSIAGMLVAALKEPNRWLPARVAEVLISFGRESLPALQEALKEKDPVLRGYIIEILGEIGDESATESLQEALGDENSNIRLQAAAALGSIRQNVSVIHLLKLLEDPEVKVRVQAIRSLGRIGGAETAGRLAGTVNDVDAAVRYASLEALRNMGPEGMNILRETASAGSHPAAGRAREIIKEEGNQDSARVNIIYKQ